MPYARENTLQNLLPNEKNNYPKISTVVFGTDITREQNWENGVRYTEAMPLVKKYTAAKSQTGLTK